MPTYHLIPSTGEPGLCTATKRPCPYGGASEHYPSPADARRAYERSMAASLSAPHLHAARTSYLSSAAVAKLQLPGVYCPTCSSPVRPEQAAHVLDQPKVAHCDHCREPFSMKTLRVKVVPTNYTYAAYDPAQVPQLTWYHSTDSEDWEDWLQRDGGFVAHLGSEQAALDRRIGQDYWEAKTSEGFWLYSVRVAEDSRIAEEVAEDSNEDYQLSSRTFWRSDVLRYVNRWEDMPHFRSRRGVPSCLWRGGASSPMMRQSKSQVFST